jgi:hypothetical protein
MNQKIIDLQKQITAEQAKIANCKHIWGKVEYDPYKTQEPYGYKLEGHGSDVWPVPEGYREVTKDRWKRVCTICGCIQHTEKRERVITDFTMEPKFD